MAAATVTNRKEFVFGSLRCIAATVTIANSGDTWVTGLGKVLYTQAEPTTNASMGVTKSGGTLTFVSGGALTMDVMAYGLR